MRSYPNNAIQCFLNSISLSKSTASRRNNDGDHPRYYSVGCLDGNRRQLHTTRLVPCFEAIHSVQLLLGHRGLEIRPDNPNQSIVEWPALCFLKMPLKTLDDPQHGGPARTRYLTGRMLVYRGMKTASDRPFPASWVQNASVAWDGMPPNSAWVGLLGRSPTIAKCSINSTYG